MQQKILFRLKLQQGGAIKSIVCAATTFSSIATFTVSLRRRVARDRRVALSRGRSVGRSGTPRGLARGTHRRVMTRRIRPPHAMRIQTVPNDLVVESSVDGRPRAPPRRVDRPMTIVARRRESSVASRWRSTCMAGSGGSAKADTAAPSETVK